MSYQNYVIAAYAVFVLAMLWDCFSPTLQIRQQLRAAKLRTARATTELIKSKARHPGESRDPV